MLLEIKSGFFKLCQVRSG